MSNLGLYQNVTTVMKKCGGPKNFIIIVSTGGYVVLRTVEFGTKKAICYLKKKTKDSNLKYHTVYKNYTDENGVEFKINDKIRILETMEDGALIEIESATDNPYVISNKTLKLIMKGD